MANGSSYQIRRIGAVDRTADLFFDALSIDKSRAVDMYDFAKKIGLCSESDHHLFDVLNEVYQRGNVNANKDRFRLAKLVASYIVASSAPDVNLSNKKIKDLVEDLAVSLVIPKEGALNTYLRLVSNKIADEAIVNSLADAYGVDKEIAEKRLAFIKMEEDLKNGEKARAEYTF